MPSKKQTKPQPIRRRRRNKPNPSDEQLFLAQVSLHIGHNIWTGSMKTPDYGQFYTSDGESVRAHRWAYEHWNGPIPPGLDVMHYCDITICMTPSHLYLGTDGDNQQDCVDKGRSGYSSPKLTEEQVIAILLDPRGGQVLAREMNVTEPTIRKVRKGIRHAHIYARYADQLPQYGKRPKLSEVRAGRVVSQASIEVGVVGTQDPRA